MAETFALLISGQPRQAAHQQAASVPLVTQTIPDAPRPQINLPSIGVITSGKGAPPNPTAARKTDVPDIPDVQQDTPKTKLPSSPATATTPTRDEAAPELPTAGQGAQAFTIRGAGVNFVEVPFTVKDAKNQPVPGIDWREVRVFENGHPQRLELFTVDPFPLSVAFVIDQSVTFDTMTKINNALSALQGAFSRYDEVAVFTYSTRPKMETNFTAAQSARLSAILERSKGKGREPIYYDPTGPLAHGPLVNGREFDPNTSNNRSAPGMTLQVPKEVHALNDAILAAAIATTKTDKGRRRIVYVISDGKEYGSEAKYKDVVKYLQTHQVSVYATVVGDSAVPGLGFLDKMHLPLTMRDNILPAYAEATGGQIDSEFRQKGIEQSFARITEEVRSQYNIGYNSHEPFLDGKFRTIEVRVLRPNLTVIARKGYFPSPAPVSPTVTSTQK